MEHFDLIVIGGGPSGYAGAMRAIDFGKKKRQCVETTFLLNIQFIHFMFFIAQNLHSTIWLLFIAFFYLYDTRNSIH